VAEFADHAAKVARGSVRIERRRYRRDGDHPGDPLDRAPENAAGDDQV
jgi:hypothetical protein